MLALAALSTTALNAQSATPSPALPPAAQFKYFPQTPQAPKGAPNVLLVMTDDVGFGVSSTFGGPVPMPHYDALAARGLRYNNFHTAALCSPSRAALLTGRNHHRVGFGALADMATDHLGYDGIIPKSAATIGQVLKANGYDTAWFGKNHNTPQWENTPFGPFDRWPIGFGFNYFYGFNGAEADQFRPSLVENLNTIRPYVGNPDYILDRDLADHAVRWLDLQKSLHSDRPFLLYWSPGTAHDPNQAPKAWLEKFRGKFDMGWDKLREQIFARQKAMGIIPKNARLTPRPAGIPAWSTLTPEQKRVAARMMEAHAAQLAFFDDQFGRVIDELKRLGKYDNTLIIYIQGDNGASQEYDIEGSNNNYAMLNGNAPTWDQMAKSIDDIGTRYSSMAIPAGWAFAQNAPFQWSKGIASHLGGQMDGMVVSWPGHIQAQGQVRSQFTHLIDVAPTIYQAIGITPPATLDGTKQMPIDGTSFAYTFNDAKAPPRHTEQYFEMVGNRAYYKDGWLANTTPVRPPWEHGPAIPPQDYHWELYDLNNDYSQSIDLAKKYPQKLAELKAGFDAAAKKYHVYPLQSDVFGRMFAGKRPTILGGQTSVTYYPGPTRYNSGMFPGLAGHSWSATAQVEVPAGGGDGTLVAQGGWPMGWGLFVIGGKPVFVYRPSDHDPEVRLTGATALSPGHHNIEARFALDAAPGTGGTATLFVDGHPAGSAHVTKAWRFINLPASVGELGDDTVIEAQQPPFKYTGTLDQVTVTLEGPSK